VSDIRIRPYRPEDRAFFQEMEFATTWESLTAADRQRLSPDEVRAALEQTHAMLLDRAGSAIFIAETAAGERVGLLWFGVNRNLMTGEDEAWVYNVSVVPAARGQGIGRRLMAHAEAHARRQGFAVLGLMVARHNAPARRLYEQLSFETTHLVMRKPL